MAPPCKFHTTAEPFLQKWSGHMITPLAAKMSERMGVLSESFPLTPSRQPSLTYQAFDLPQLHGLAYGRRRFVV